MPRIPSRLGARDDVQLLASILTHVGDVQEVGSDVEGDAPRIPETVHVDLGARRSWPIGERVVEGDGVSSREGHPVYAYTQYAASQVSRILGDVGLLRGASPSLTAIQR